MDSDRSNLSLNEEASKRCDELANELLTKIKRRRELSEYGVIEYVEAESGDILLVCGDGSCLYTPGELGRSMSLKAFKNGFRSDRDALKQLCNVKHWEGALL